MTIALASRVEVELRDLAAACTVAGQRLGREREAAQVAHALATGCSDLLLWEAAVRLGKITAAEAAPENGGPCVALNSRLKPLLDAVDRLARFYALAEFAERQNERRQQVADRQAALIEDKRISEAVREAALRVDSIIADWRNRPIEAAANARAVEVAAKALPAACADLKQALAAAGITGPNSAAYPRNRLECQISDILAKESTPAEWHMLLSATFDRGFELQLAWEGWIGWTWPAEETHDPRKWHPLKRNAWMLQKLENATTLVKAIVDAAIISTPPFDPAPELQELVGGLYKTWKFVYSGSDQVIGDDDANRRATALLKFPEIKNEYDARNAIIELQTRLGNLHWPQTQNEPPTNGQPIDPVDPPSLAAPIPLFDDEAGKVVGMFRVGDAALLTAETWGGYGDTPQRYLLYKTRDGVFVFVETSPRGRLRGDPDVITPQHGERATAYLRSHGCEFEEALEKTGAGLYPAPVLNCRAMRLTAALAAQKLDELSMELPEELVRAVEAETAPVKPTATGQPVEDVETRTDGAEGEPETKGKEINKKMLVMLQEDATRYEWSAEEWAARFKCSKSSIHATKSWKTIMAMRAKDAVENDKPFDRRRVGKKNRSERL